MKELMLEGYTTESTAAAKNGNCWYLPHHGVYNQSKSGKCRISQKTDQQVIAAWS